jgi:hypothetical protein
LARFCLPGPGNEADIGVLAEIVGSRPETLRKQYQHVTVELHRRTVNAIPNLGTDFVLESILNYVCIYLTVEPSDTEAVVGSNLIGPIIFNLHQIKFYHAGWAINASYSPHPSCDFKGH